MNPIEKVCVIDKGQLSEAFYFESLLEEGYRAGLLKDADIEKVKMDSLKLLAEKIKMFTGGDSSVRVEAAENMMKSIFYTIGLHLKTFSSPLDAVDFITETSFNDLYGLGRKKLKTKRESLKLLHHSVIKSMTGVQNIFYFSTLVNGLNHFFKLYTDYYADYNAHEIPAEVIFDYPVCNPVDEFIGIEYAQQYLNAVYYENKFCGYFSDEAIHRLLYGYNPSYADLVFNIFEKVLAAAMACVMAGEEAESLQISDCSLEKLRQKLFNQSNDEIEWEIFNAYTALIAEIGLTDTPTQAYIKKALPKLAAGYKRRGE